MASYDFLPSLTEYDIQRAIELVLQAYSPSSATLNVEQMKRLQQDLFELQKRFEAWGLVIPMLNHQDQQVQFFGAHTAQVKIVRDWDSFPKEHSQSLRDMMIQLTAHSIAIGRNKVILRKLFVALTSLALKIVPGHPSLWPDWILSCVTAFSSHGTSTECAHDFLAIVAEEVANADLLGPGKIQIQQSMTDATPLTVQSIISIISQPWNTFSIKQCLSALKCLQAWMPYLKGEALVSIIPLLIVFLGPSFPEDLFVATSDVLQELTSKSALADGAGSKTLTEPLLVWLDNVGKGIMDSTYTTAIVSPVSHSLCKLLVALGDHSTTYLAVNIASSATVVSGPSLPQTTRGHLVQNFLRSLLAYTGLPGFYGADEDESEMTLGFWYLLQEALWTADFNEDGNNDETPSHETTFSTEATQVVMAKAVYVELIKVLRRKVTFPPSGSGWSRDQVDKFQVYRRDIGDTLINAYYVLRADMLEYFVREIEERLPHIDNGWQEVEASLHCIMSIHEAVDFDKSPQLRRLFSPQVFGQLPSSGRSRVRRTALGVIGAYSMWFSIHPSPIVSSSADQPNLLLGALSYVVSALPDPVLCQSAATALKKLCDANRKELALHIAAFGELHSSLNAIPDSEKSKVLHSIASVIQAMPIEHEIPAVEAIVNPINEDLYKSLQIASDRPEEARHATILHLETLAGVAKGLTRALDGMAVLEDETDPTYQEETTKIKRAREDVRVVNLRHNIFSVIKKVIEWWSSDAAIAQTLSDLIKAITSLPSDVTLITLPAAPLLELVCLASQEQLTATWLSLASILIAQLNPPVFSFSLKSGPTPEAEMTVQRFLPVLIQRSLSFLTVDDAMESNPDIVQEFFGCMDRIAQDFTSSFYSLPLDLLDAVLICAIKSLSLQERYSLVSACNFLSNLINRSSLSDELVVHKNQILSRHGRSIMQAVLEGFAGVAPRSAVQNLIELLGTLLNRASGGDGPDGGAQQWMNEILISDDFIPNKATSEVKVKFLKTVAGSRFNKRVREAAQQFTLVARGLEGSNFGYSSMTM